MLKYIYRRYIALACFLVFVILDPVASSLLNFLLQRIFNMAGMQAGKNAIVHMLTIGFLLWMGKRIIIVLMAGIKNYIICNVRADLKEDIFRRILLHFSMDVNNTSTGMWTSMFTNDITLIENRYIESFLSIISSALSIVVLSGSFLTLNITLAAFILGFGVLSLSVPIFFSRLLNRMSYAWSRQLGVFTQCIREFFAAFPTIKNYAIESQIDRKFVDIDQKTEANKFDADFTLSVANNSAAMLAWFMQFIAVAAGVVMMAQGRILLGTVIAAQSFSSDIAVPLIGLVNNINAMRSTRAIVQKLEEYADNTPRENDPAEPPVSPSLSSGLVFSGVSLSLEGREIISDFTYTFEKGKKYLIVGKNGSGKSSLFRMLVRYHRSTHGLIAVDGQPVAQMDNRALSSRISYMNEDVMLFTDRVEENILLYREQERYKLSDAMQATQLHLDLERIISDNIQAVSSGERRRIEISRTLLSGADIMIFDEVISTLDTETAYEIEKMVLGFDGYTVIQISHNFSRTLIEQYDDILIMDSGRLCAHGTFRELMRTSAYFRKICSIKFGEGIVEDEV